MKEAGVLAENITFINLISVDQGLNKVLNDHPGVNIITAAIDSGINEHKYIVPGLGDFGDRYYGSNIPNWANEKL